MGLSVTSYLSGSSGTAVRGQSPNSVWQGDLAALLDVHQGYTAIPLCSISIVETPVTEFSSHRINNLRRKQPVTTAQRGPKGTVTLTCCGGRTPRFLRRPVSSSLEWSLQLRFELPDKHLRAQRAAGARRHPDPLQLFCFHDRVTNRLGPVPGFVDLPPLPAIQQSPPVTALDVRHRARPFVLHRPLRQPRPHWVQVDLA